MGICEWAQAHPWVSIKHRSCPAEDISKNVLIFPRRASCSLMQGTIKYFCHHSQALLSTEARCTILFLSPIESCFMILCHAAALLLSFSTLIVTLFLPVLFASVLRRPVITQFYLSAPGTSSQACYAIKVELTLTSLSLLSVSASYHSGCGRDPVMSLQTSRTAPLPGSVPGSLP